MSTPSPTARPRFTCFGSSRVAPDSPAAEAAYAVGAILAARGIDVLSGGYDGAMGAVSRGAAEAGGVAIGVTTPIFPEREANPHVREEWSEPDYVARLATLCRQADGYVALPGGLGTLSEWLTVWCLASIRQTRGPLYVFEDPWRPVFDAVLSLSEVRSEHTDLVHWLRSPEDLATALDRTR